MFQLIAARKALIIRSSGYLECGFCLVMPIGFHTSLLGLCVK
ncbi:hypothetical protein PPIS_b0514 [Pseudoalteromonas piscicida]|uniref:DUF3265 domain-containing protein n=1 Tax=Pseudoalteromonas piscicida TaxID=43662 RepID=A0ABN5CRM2_PSEO7|nr:hypothetical protein PPIS_b0514 [Pseudoalteromonas piscicida]